eukprot:556381-Prymnesium_polylepis.2
MAADLDDRVVAIRARSCAVVATGMSPRGWSGCELATGAMGMMVRRVVAVAREARNGGYGAMPQGGAFAALRTP